MSGMSHKIVEKIGARLAHLFAYYCIPAWIMTCQRWISQFPRRVIMALFTPFVMVVKSLIITGNRFYFSFVPQQLWRELICLFYFIFNWICFYYAFNHWIYFYHYLRFYSLGTEPYSVTKGYNGTLLLRVTTSLSICLSVFFSCIWQLKFCFFLRRFCWRYNSKKQNKINKKLNRAPTQQTWFLVVNSCMIIRSVV